MPPDHWHLTEDLDDFLVRAGEFLRSRPALHTVPLTVTETLRAHGQDMYGTGTPVFGLLERAGEVRAAFFRTPPHRLNVTPLTGEEADSLAARLAGLGHALPGINAEHGTAAAFAGAWRRHTGTTPVLGERQRLYRLGTPTVPRPVPPGRSRVADDGDEELLGRWTREFAAAVGEAPPPRTPSRVRGRFAHKRFTFWEEPGGSPVAMAGTTRMVAGQVRVAPVYTPAHLRGRGYAGAATVEAGRAALAAGAREVVLFADLANPTSNGLYRRIGYVPVSDFALWDFR
ncbi:GNAT family N-acetyltransferase [Streptomyces sp. CRN 30]|uniref:GNAT family N-acetyltransferase n=1 Tax=Streptomyces sp. CRN 30 TaxID=3075613 RepID=UPI002A80A337|nr:GNAT family N-acetyltransferase [Streptomyces sp. CRN 30]